ncbi:uncharacterized protein, partial [Centruroides vittatus]|uniref:uncharacterized protein n=1 Tax=Centruroides vittatus TaxID=120091 RepID=UPI00351022EB
KISGGKDRAPAGGRARGRKTRQRLGRDVEQRQSGGFGLAHSPLAQDERRPPASIRFERRVSGRLQVQPGHRHFRRRAPSRRLLPPPAGLVRGRALSPSLARRKTGIGRPPESEEEEERGVYRTLASLALLCLLSLPLSFLALFFLQRAGPAPSPDGSEATVSGRDGATVHQVSVALGTLTVCLDLCCLFVCCLQFLFALKLLQTPRGVDRTDRFLKRSSHTRLLAIGGFFLSIPLFFTGIILFGFVHFQELPAAVTGAAVGAGIVFCGVASVHDVYLWQGHKTDASRALIESRLSRIREASLPPDSGPHVAELSTLV